MGFMFLLIHEADPQTWSLVIMVFTNVFRPHFSKQNRFQVKTMFATGDTVGLAEWIIDDTCLVFFCFLSHSTDLTEMEYLSYNQLNRDIFIVVDNPSISYLFRTKSSFLAYNVQSFQKMLFR